MASLNPIQIGKSNRLEILYSNTKQGLVRKPTSKNSRETSPGFYNEPSLNYSSQTLKVDPSKRYK